MLLLTPQNWKQYQLLDSGNQEKLEKFGNFILTRPEPQALWDKSLSEEEWNKTSHAIFKKDPVNPDKGIWNVRKKMPESWNLHYGYKEMKLVFNLSLSSFKHVGVFPEQGSNWDYIFDKTKAMSARDKKPKVLNLFAYTGGASLAAKFGGADVTHLDAIKQTVTTAKENMDSSNLTDIRWIVDDAMKFVKREVKRGNKYNGIILDPPVYGRGPTGERWHLEQHLKEMLKICNDILDPINNFIVINLYSLGFSVLLLENLVNNCFTSVKNSELGELYIPDQFQKKLPLGIFYRFSSVNTL